VRVRGVKQRRGFARNIRPLARRHKPCDGGNHGERTLINRRRFFEFLAASPLITSGADVLAQERRLPDPSVWGPRTIDKLIASPREALDVFDFEPVMHKNVPPAHFGYMTSGVDDEVTLRANRAGFQKFQLKPRRLVDVSVLDTKLELFGQTYSSPIFVSPTGSNRAFHEDGELAVARAAKTGNHLQVLSTVATTSIEDAIAARGRPVWFQLYPTDKWEVAEALAKRAEKAGAETIVVTVDVLARQNWETNYRLWRTDTRDCSACHGRDLKSFLQRKPNFEGIDISGLSTSGATTLTWAFLKRLRGAVKTKLVVKGLMTAEDARLAADNGLDAIIVSNHGGRVDDSGRSTIDALPEILEAVGGRMPVLVDSGFRRGTDIVKALAMGARAVGVGRPYLWGLGAFGQAGVERVLGLLHNEVRSVMMQMGAPSLKDLVPAMVRRA
jgi:4-hydroxymandelate oxidase